MTERQCFPCSKLRDALQLALDHLNTTDATHDARGRRVDTSSVRRYLRHALLGYAHPAIDRFYYCSGLYHRFGIVDQLTGNRVTKADGTELEFDLPAELDKEITRLNTAAEKEGA